MESSRAWATCARWDDANDNNNDHDNGDDNHDNNDDDFEQPLRFLQLT